MVPNLVSTSRIRLTLQLEYFLKMSLIYCGCLREKNFTSEFVVFLEDESVVGVLVDPEV